MGKLDKNSNLFPVPDGHDQVVHTKETVPYMEVEGLNLDGSLKKRTEKPTIELVKDLPQVNHTGELPANHTDNGDTKHEGTTALPEESVILKLQDDIKAVEDLQTKVDLYDELIAKLTIANNRTKLLDIWQEQLEVFLQILENMEDSKEKDKEKIASLKRDIAARYSTFAQICVKSQNYPTTALKPIARIRKRFEIALAAIDQAIKLQPGNQNYDRFQEKLIEEQILQETEHRQTLVREILGRK